MKIEPFQITDEHDDKITLGQHATHKTLLFVAIEGHDGYASVQLTREQASKLRDWLEHQWLDKV